MLDEEVELEDQFLVDEERFTSDFLPPSPLPPPAAKSLTPMSTPSADSNVSPPSADSSVSLTKSQKKNLAKRVRERAKRADAAQHRKATNNLKPRAVQHARGAQPSLIDFDASSLPVSSTGWTGVRSLGKLPAGLQRVWRNLAVLTGTKGLRLLAWDGETCIVLVDKSDRIVGVLGGVPPGSRGADWQSLIQRLNSAIKKCSDQSTFTSKETCHPRGGFTAHATGIGYGGGRQVPGNVKISGVANQKEMQELMLNADMQRVVGFSNCA